MLLFIYRQGTINKKEETKMKNVMAYAWNIAKAAAKKHGGKAIQYISGSLKMAWALHKKAQKSEYKMVVTANMDTKTNTVEFHTNGVCGTVESNLTKMDYVGIVNKFARRGAKIMEMYRLMDGVKSFFGYVEVA